MCACSGGNPAWGCGGNCGRSLSGTPNPNSMAVGVFAAGLAGILGILYLVLRDVRRA